MSAATVFLLLIAQFAIVIAVPFDLDQRDYDRHPRPENDIKSDKLNLQFDLSLENTADFWIKTGRNIVKEHKNNNIVNANKAKNVILFLGDGMSISTITAARIYQGQLKGKSGEEEQLSFEKFPVTGLAKNYCVDRQVADSACSATAYLTGVKSNFYTIGVTGKVKPLDCDGMIDPANHTHSILEKAMHKGKRTGIVTTTRVTDASPAGTYGHTANRNWESNADVELMGYNATKCRDLAHQLIHHYPGRDFNVILGCGRRNFLSVPNIYDVHRGAGFRIDGRNLIEEWKMIKSFDGKSHEYVENRNQLLHVATSTDYLLGLFSSSHCDYHLDADKLEQPTLQEKMEAALKILTKNDEGYFLFVEGGLIDHGHHDNKAHYALDETVEFAKAIDRAVELTNREDTLIVVTSDHSHTMTINGYPGRGNGILLNDDRYVALDKLPYMTLSYANGMGYRPEKNGKRVNITKDDISSPEFLYPALDPMLSETHGGEDIAVFAYGPGQHLFAGSYEQNAIAHIISYISCIDDEFSLCNGD